MKKIHCALFATLVTIVIISCQKEFSVEGGTIIISPTVLDSNYLDTVYEFSTRTGITDTTAYYSYKYDAQKRVVSINWQWGDFLLPYQDSGSIKYFYNGADSLPYKSYMVTTYDGMLVFDTLNTFYTYDNSARLIKDSSVASDRGTASPYYRVRQYLNLYNYAAGKITRQSSDLPIIEPTPIAYPPTYMLDTAIIDANQNPVTTVNYISRNNNTSFVKDHDIIIGYDNKPSPYYKLNIFNSSCPIPALDQTFFLNYTGKNNYINYTTGSSTVVYTNVYFSNGYLKKTSYPSEIDPAFTDGYIYTFKAL